MKSLQPATDTCAVGFSLACAVHCLFTPVLVTVLPASIGIPLQDEAFHLWLVVAVIPTSIIAITLGCRLHEQYVLVGFAALGVAILIFPLVLGEGVLSPAAEKGITLLGSTIVAVVHILNFRWCRTRCRVSPEAEEYSA